MFEKCRISGGVALELNQMCIFHQNMLNMDLGERLSLWNVSIRFKGLLLSCQVLKYRKTTK